MYSLPVYDINQGSIAATIYHTASHNIHTCMYIMRVYMITYSPLYLPVYPNNLSNTHVYANTPSNTS